MQPIQTTKTVLAMYPQRTDNGAMSNNTYVDTQGWAHVRWIIARPARTRDP